jgi:hypothetical protein
VILDSTKIAILSITGFVSLVLDPDVKLARLDQLTGSALNAFRYLCFLLPMEFACVVQEPTIDLLRLIVEHVLLTTMLI